MIIIMSWILCYILGAMDDGKQSVQKSSENKNLGKVNIKQEPECYTSVLRNTVKGTVELSIYI